MFSQQLPYEEVIIGTGDPIKVENLVEFRLLYQGELKASGKNKTRAPHKHEIRRAFHLQLRRLWNVKAGLRNLAEDRGNPGNGEPEPVDMPRDGYLLHSPNPYRLWFRVGFNSGVKDPSQGNGLGYQRLLHEAEEELAATF